MEVLSTAIIANTGYSGLEQIVDQSTGVNAMGGQVSIGGGGEMIMVKEVVFSCIEWNTDDVFCYWRRKTEFNSHGANRPN
jgi:hypothetical protein